VGLLSLKLNGIQPIIPGLVEMIVPIFPANRGIIGTREKPKRATLTVPQLFALYSEIRESSHYRAWPCADIRAAWQGGYFVPRCIPQEQGFHPLHT